MIIKFLNWAIRNSKVHLVLIPPKRSRQGAICTLIGAWLFGLCHAEASNFLKKGAAISEYHYTSSDRRDPFQSLENTGRPIIKESSVLPRKTADLLQARWTLLGIISGQNGEQVVIQSAEGKRYIVSNGDELFSENVRVVRVTRSSVILESTSPPRIMAHGTKVPSLELTFTRPVER